MDLLKMWSKFNRFPGGRFAFTKVLGHIIPYSGTICPTILSLEAGRARVRLPDVRRNRNHLNSIHAVALMNVAELTSGLAFTTAIPPDARAILVGFSIEFLKKARGNLVGEANFGLIPTSDARECTVDVDIKNEEGAVVCRAHAKWKMGPQK